jgi:hypothetical protein
MLYITVNYVPMNDNSVGNRGLNYLRVMAERDGLHVVMYSGRACLTHYINSRFSAFKIQLFTVVYKQLNVVRHNLWLQ